jgi:hypothetical protein
VFQAPIITSRSDTPAGESIVRQGRVTLPEITAGGFTSEGITGIAQQAELLQPHEFIALPNDFKVKRIHTAQCDFYELRAEITPQLLLRTLPPKRCTKKRWKVLFHAIHAFNRQYLAAPESDDEGMRMIFLYGVKVGRRQYGYEGYTFKVIEGKWRHITGFNPRLWQVGDAVVISH